MTFGERVEAIGSLTEFSIKYRERDFRKRFEKDLEPWYVSQRVEVKSKSGGTLVTISGNGETPEEAIEDHWKKLVELGSDEYIVVNAGDNDRQAVQWNGFMWKKVTE